MSARRQKRCGYVLVLTLGLITLSAISLAGLARYSLGITTQGSDAVEELQRRWGLLSARHVIHDRAAELLAGQVPPDEASTPPWPKPNSIQSTFKLGGLQFTALIADEDAKVNVNTICARQPERLADVVRRVRSGATGLRIRPIGEITGATPVRSWGQVLDLNSGSTQADVAENLIDMGRTLTCWGSGRLNLCRASDTAVREIASLALSTKDVGELISFRKNWGGQSVDDLLAQLDLRRPQLLAARRVFSSDSHNYSLWIDIDNGQRTWSFQYVNDGGLVNFAW